MRDCVGILRAEVSGFMYAISQRRQVFSWLPLFCMASPRAYGLAIPPILLARSMEHQRILSDVGGILVLEYSHKPRCHDYRPTS